MPFKKKEIICFFCKKEILGKKYQINNAPLYQLVLCGGCREIFLMIRRETNTDANKKIMSMLSHIMMEKRHCVICKHFDKHREGKCMRGMWTGLDMVHRARYPLSYANDGCDYYNV